MPEGALRADSSSVVMVVGRPSSRLRRRMTEGLPLINTNDDNSSISVVIVCSIDTSRQFRESRLRPKAAAAVSADGAL
jgi:hypothetical protein